MDDYLRLTCANDTDSASGPLCCHQAITQLLSAGGAAWTVLQGQQGLHSHA